jgi:hypothetical protein
MILPTPEMGFGSCFVGKSGSFSHKKDWYKILQSIENKVIARIYGKGRGWAFSPKHFLDLGPRKSVDMALTRLRQAGTIRHLARGLYDYPAKHPKLGLLSPSPESVARAIAKSDAIRLCPALHLSLTGI